MSESYYDVAQICRNGHVINSSAKSYPEHNQKHCERCGAPAVMQCEECNTEIRGRYHVVGILDLSASELPAPSFCHNCGAAHPWTLARLEVARELVDDFEELDDSEKAQLKDNLSDIIQETPRSELAGRRWKKLLGKVGQDAYEAMRSILIEIASETAKKSLFGP